MENPILYGLKLKTGELIESARIKTEAPEIPGYLALEKPPSLASRGSMTTYVALGDIASFSVLDEEACTIRCAFEEVTT